MFTSTGLRTYLKTSTFGSLEISWECYFNLNELTANTKELRRKSNRAQMTKIPGSLNTCIFTSVQTVAVISFYKLCMWMKRN